MEVGAMEGSVLGTGNKEFSAYEECKNVMN